MNDTEIIEIIRRGIREPVPDTVSDSQLLATIGYARTVLGAKIKNFAPFCLYKRVSVASSSNMFTLPADCETILSVYDMGASAGTITGATNATPIVITETSHPRVTTDVVFIHNVVGNTAANGQWKITYINANTYSLNGSVGSGTYTSGGKVFKETGDFVELERISEGYAKYDDTSQYFQRYGCVAVNSLDFDNDIIIRYHSRIAATSDVPSQWHLGLAAFAVLYHLIFPKQEDPSFANIKKSYDFFSEIWKAAIEDITSGYDYNAQPIKHDLNKLRGAFL